MTEYNRTQRDPPVWLSIEDLLNRLFAAIAASQGELTEIVHIMRISQLNLSLQLRMKRLFSRLP